MVVGDILLNFVDFANYFGNYLTYYREDGMTNATSLYSYINALYNGGYFTADFNSYYGSVLQVFNTINFLTILWDCFQSLFFMVIVNLLI